MLCGNIDQVRVIFVAYRSVSTFNMRTYKLSGGVHSLTSYLHHIIYIRIHIRKKRKSKKRGCVKYETSSNLLFV